MGLILRVSNGTDVATMSQNESIAGAHQSPESPAYSGVDELWHAENYMKGYNASVVAKLSRHLFQKKVLEFGAGIGSFARLWELQNQSKPECLEIDPVLREVLITRGFVTYANLGEVQNTYEGIYTSNVIEHIDDDVATLKQLSQRVIPGGYVVVYVPAFMCLFSDLDRSVGHYRRYERKELMTKIKAANLNIVSWSYVDSVGFFASLAVRIFGYKGNSPLGSARSFQIYDRFVYPISRVLDFLGLRFLFGKNLLVIARK